MFRKVEDMVISPNLRCIRDETTTEDMVRSFVHFVKDRGLEDNHLVGDIFFLVYVVGREEADGFSCEFPPVITEHFFTESNLGWAEVDLFFSTNGDRVTVTDSISRMDTPQEWEEELTGLFDEWRSSQ